MNVTNSAISISRLNTEERIPKLIVEWIPREGRKRGTPKENVDGMSTSSHDKK
jgi:hypothetical protein